MSGRKRTKKWKEEMNKRWKEIEMGRRKKKKAVRGIVKVKVFEDGFRHYLILFSA